MAESLRYSDADLAEFKENILRKLNVAKEEYNNLRKQIRSENDNGTDDTASAYVSIDDGSASQQKENAGQLASRQQKYIANLENALIRVGNRTYGICRVTGLLIARERLKAVPHTTQSMEAKKNQYK
jgi:DnaK suppressor protein